MVADAQLRTRPATAADYDYLYRLHLATMREYVARTWGWDEAVQAEMFHDRFNPSAIEVIELRGRPVGMWSVNETHEEITLRSVEVEPEYQRRGIGTGLLVQLLERATTTRRTVRLSVLKVNPARRLYERLGFQTIDETPTHLVMRAGL